MFSHRIFICLLPSVTVYVGKVVKLLGYDVVLDIDMDKSDMDRAVRFSGSVMIHLRLDEKEPGKTAAINMNELPPLDIGENLKLGKPDKPDELGEFWLGHKRDPYVNHAAPRVKKDLAKGSAEIYKTTDPVKTSPVVLPKKDRLTQQLTRSVMFNLGDTVDTNSSFDIQLFFTGEEAPGAMGQMSKGLMYSTYNQIISQSEYQGARRIFPCYDDPEFKTYWKLTVRARSDYRAISNAPVSHRINIADRSAETVFEKTELPMPTYAFGLMLTRHEESSIESIDSHITGQNKKRVYSMWTLPGYNSRKKRQMSSARFVPYIPVFHNGINYMESLFTGPMQGSKIGLPTLNIVSSGAVLSFMSSPGYGLMVFSGNLFEFHQGSTVSGGETKLIKPSIQQFVLSLSEIYQSIAQHWFGNIITPSDPFFKEQYIKAGLSAMYGLKTLASTHAVSANSFNAYFHVVPALRYNGRGFRSAAVYDHATYPTTGDYPATASSNYVPNPRDIHPMVALKGAAAFFMIEEYISPECFQAAMDELFALYKYSIVDDSKLKTVLENAANCSEVIHKTEDAYVILQSYVRSTETRVVTLKVEMPPTHEPPNPFDPFYEALLPHPPQCWWAIAGSHLSSLADKQNKDATPPIVQKPPSTDASLVVTENKGDEVCPDEKIVDLQKGIGKPPPTANPSFIRVKCPSKMILWDSQHEPDVMDTDQKTEKGRPDLATDLCDQEDLRAMPVADVYGSGGRNLFRLRVDHEDLHLFVNADMFGKVNDVNLFRMWSDTVALGKEHAAAVAPTFKVYASTKSPSMDSLMYNFDELAEQLAEESRDFLLADLKNLDFLQLLCNAPAHPTWIAWQVYRQLTSFMLYVRTVSSEPHVIDDFLRERYDAIFQEAGWPSEKHDSIETINLERGLLRLSVLKEACLVGSYACIEEALYTYQEVYGSRPDLPDWDERIIDLEPMIFCSALRYSKDPHAAYHQISMLLQKTQARDMPADAYAALFCNEIPHDVKDTWIHNAPSVFQAERLTLDDHELINFLNHAKDVKERDKYVRTQTGNEAKLIDKITERTLNPVVGDLLALYYWRSTNPAIITAMKHRSDRASYLKHADARVLTVIKNCPAPLTGATGPQCPHAKPGLNSQWHLPPHAPGCPQG